MFCVWGRKRRGVVIVGIVGLRQPGRDLKGEESRDMIDMGEFCLKWEGILQVLAYSVSVGYDSATIMNRGKG